MVSVAAHLAQPKFTPVKVEVHSLGLSYFGSPLFPALIRPELD
jgi:hypothetical protein